MPPWMFGWSDSPLGQPSAGVLQVTAPTAEVVRFHVTVASLSRGNIRQIVAAARDAAVHAGLPGIVFVEFANPTLRRVCHELRMGYADETGWVYLRNDGHPALLLTAQGATRASASARDATITNLGGSGAGKVIRALWQFNGFPVGVREIAELAKVSPGTVSKILPTLALSGAADRDDAGRVTRVSHRLLLDRWTQDYGFTTSNRSVTWYLAPKGLLATQQKLAALPAGFKIRSTGPLAARSELKPDVLSVAPLTLLAYYTDDPAYLADRCGLIETEQPSAANVVMAQPRDLNDDDDLISMFQGSPASIRAVPLSQVLADLMTMGGRYPDQAEQLFSNRFPEEADLG